METKHTPAPWGLCFHLQSHENDASCTCGYRGSIWGSDEEHVVCEMGSTIIAGQEGLEAPRYPRDVELANARLIAAAPELLEAAKAVETWWLTEGMTMTGMSGSPYCMFATRAAIAKATGAAQ